MRRLWFSLALLAFLPALAPAEDSKGPVLSGKNTPLKPLVSGLKNPESVCVGPDGKVYVTTIGEFDKDGDGAVMVVNNGKAEEFAKGLDDPKGIAFFNGYFYVADKTRVVRIDAKGKVDTFVAAKDFPRAPKFLNDVEIGYPTFGGATLYVSDSGDLKGKGGAVYAVPIRQFPRQASTAGKPTFLVDGEKDEGVKTPNGLFKASQYHLFMLDAGSGKLSRVTLADKKRVEVAEGFDGGDGVCHDDFGRLYVTSWKLGRVWVIPRPGEKPVLLASGFQSAADCCLSADRKSILVPDMKAGTLTAVPCTVPGAEVDESELPVKIEPAFAAVKWAGFTGTDDKGKPMEFRPLVLTHAGDGTDRVFVATQQGVVHVLPNDPKAKASKVFLDVRDRVHFNPLENEEGLLGLAFAPDYKKTGYFYAYYTVKPGKFQKGQKWVNVLSRFKTSKDDPDKADPDSEEIVLKLPQRLFWNHDGGTLAFGPDGMLYVAVGDGGLANDPKGHGQNLDSLLGKILRIDVSKKDEGLKYAIPKDNPFVGKKGHRGEIWAYGLRNVWRMSFDRKTGKLWAADVGQDLWEEIDLIEKGGNYGWNPREGLHPFGVKGVEPNQGMIEPIWEYHHDVGKSMTGGHVYRGSRVKALQGLYLYADYVAGHVWGLRYDEKKKRVTGNHWLRKGGFAVYSFGEDEKGEVYLLTSAPDGKGLFRFAEK
jgi:glucose/arabinose dehydrogenase